MLACKLNRDNIVKLLLSDDRVDKTKVKNNGKKMWKY